MSKRPKPLVLLISDGFGLGVGRDNHAFACSPCWDELQAGDPMTALGCSGDGVGQRNTHQNMNDVPLMHVGRRKSLLSCGSLADFAPAILAILDVSQSIEMTGRPLIGQ